MSVQVKGSGTIGGLDEGLVVSGIVTASTQINVGSNIKVGSAGVVTATTFSGSGASLTNLPAGNLTGTVADARISTLTASKLTGALPAISGANLTGITQTTINSNTNNYLITGTGTANTLQGEAKLTFDGDKLYVKNSSGNAGIDLNVSSGVNPRLDFNTANVASSGIIKSEESGNGSIMEFHNKNSSGGEQQVMTLTTDRNVSINDGNLIVANGHGIDFSATANAQPGQYNSINPTTDSEVLHDYEYGSFTPHIRTQGGTSNATYAQKGGYYTKIGRMVYCTFFMNWSNGSNHSGYIYFVGLPYFSGSNTSSHLMYGIGTVQLNGFTISGNRNPLLHMGEQTSGTNLASNNSGGNSINEGHTSNGYIIANITYIANY